MVPLAFNLAFNGELRPVGRTWDHNNCLCSVLPQPGIERWVYSLGGFCDDGLAEIDSKGEKERDDERLERVLFVLSMMCQNFIRRSKW